MTSRTNASGRMQRALVPILAVGAALAIGAIMLLALGANPLTGYKAMRRVGLGIRRQDAEPGHADPQPLGRQHPEADPGPGAVGEPAGPDCGSADAGVDIGAAEYIHSRLVEARGTGTAIVVISEDLDEILALSDRVAVMFEGRIVGTVDPAAATREEIGLMMAGVVDHG